MPRIVLEAFVSASPEVCFDLVRDPRVHSQATMSTGGAAGSDGKIGLGQRITFEGRHFGLRQRFTVEVVEVDRPNRFVDEMREGTFMEFRHVHEYLAQDGGTLMKDSLFWTSPLGILGSIADKLVIERHMKRLVATRNARLKEIAEAKKQNFP